MLICHNCSTIQENGVDRCRHCNMEGKLAPWNEKTEILPGPAPTTICLNCGSETPGDGEQCVECCFPLPAVARNNRFPEKSGGRFSLRAG